MMISLAVGDPKADPTSQLPEREIEPRTAVSRFQCSHFIIFFPFGASGGGPETGNQSNTWRTKKKPALKKKQLEELHSGVLQT